MIQTERLHSVPMRFPWTISAAVLVIALGCKDEPKVACGEGMGLTLDGRCIPLDSDESDPHLGTVELYPEDVRTDDTLFSRVVVDDEALDTGIPFEDYKVRYMWFVDGREVSGTANHLHGYRYFEKDQDISLVVSRLDGTGSSIVSKAVTAGNTAPAKPVVHITPSAPLAQIDDLSCEAAPTYDADGDRLTYRVQWTVDGLPWGRPPPPPDDGGGYTVDTGRRVDTGAPSPEPGVVPAGETIGGQEWTCTITAYDGEEFGLQGSSTVEIQRGFGGWDAEIVNLGDSDYIMQGRAGGDFTGAGLANAGDVDGDGLGDMLIPAYFSDQGTQDAGLVYLVRAQDLGEPGTLELSEMPYQFTGWSNSEEAGHSTASAGDIDGDGLDDLLICGYRNDDPVFDVGRVYVLRASELGSPRIRSLSTAEITFVGEATENRLGHAVASAGDLDGDGWVDLLMGAYGNDESATDAGKTYVVPGISLDGFAGERTVGEQEYMFLGEGEDDASGHALRTAYDVDGDGLDDFVIGARRNDTGARDGGKVYLILGSSLGSPGDVVSLTDADYGFYGEVEEGWVGYQTTGVEDVDGDGLGDVLIGAHMSDEAAGRVYLIFGASLDASLMSTEEADVRYTGQYAADQAGRSISSGGDVDGDGLGDILVGARNHWDRVGTAYLILGASVTAGIHALEDSDYAFDGEERGDEAGYTTSTAGDVNGDGLDDILVGAWQGNHDLETSLPGKAYLLLAPEGD